MGALSKKIEKSRVCPLFFDFEPTDVKGPLTTLQATKFNKDDFKKLITTINNLAGDQKLDVQTLDTVFNKWWPDLEQQIDAVLRSHTKSPKKDKRTDRDILEELLELTRMTFSRPPRIVPQAIIDLVESLDELTSTLIHERGGLVTQRCFHILRRIERPLKYICMESNIPEAYEQYRRRIRPLFDIERERSRKSPDPSNDKLNEE